MRLGTTLEQKPPGGSRFFRRVTGLRVALLLLLCLVSVFLTEAGTVRAGGSIPVPEDLLRKMGFIVFDDRERAPEVTGPAIEGGSQTLAAYRGHWVLLNFWATWCVPCRTEIPTLVRLSKHMSGRNFVLLSVAMDHETSRIRSFLRKTPVDYPVVEGRKGTVDSRYVGMGLPETYLIDPEGYLVGKAAGSRDWSGNVSYDLFDRLTSSRRSGTSSPGKDPS